MTKKKNEITMEKMEFVIELTSPMLGTVPKDPEVYKSYIADKAKEAHPDRAGEIDEEVEGVEKIEEKGWTGFHSDENGLFIYDYMIRGFIKSAIETLMENGAIKKIVAYKKWIDRLVFVGPRKIYFGKSEPDHVIERPLRAMTAQGPRVSLARSDAINVGQQIKFEITVLANNKGIDMDIIGMALSYGQYVGLGQWRGSGGYGQFVVVE